MIAILILFESLSFAVDWNPLKDLPTITPEQQCERTLGMVSATLGIGILDQKFESVDCDKKPKEAMTLLTGILQKGQNEDLNPTNTTESVRRFTPKSDPYCTLNVYRPAKAMVLITPLIRGDKMSCHQSCINAAATQCDEDTAVIPYMCDYLDPKASIKVTALPEGKVGFQCPIRSKDKVPCWYKGSQMGLFSSDFNGEEECAQAAFKSLKPSYEDCHDEGGLPLVSGEYPVSISVDLGGKKFNKNSYEFIQNCSEFKKATSKNPITPDSIKDHISK